MVDKHSTEFTKPIHLTIIWQAVNYYLEDITALHHAIIVELTQILDHCYTALAVFRQVHFHTQPDILHHAINHMCSNCLLQSTNNCRCYLHTVLLSLNLNTQSISKVLPKFSRQSSSLSTVWYEGRLISNAHSEISRKRDHVFKQTKVGSKVQYFSYKLTYLFFDTVALSFNTFFPT